VTEHNIVRVVLFLIAIGLKVVPNGSIFTFFRVLAKINTNGLNVITFMIKIPCIIEDPNFELLPLPFNLSKKDIVIIVS